MRHSSSRSPLVGSCRLRCMPGMSCEPGLVGVVALDPSTRLREEDPFTDRMLGDIGIRAVVNRSRFEVDLNRSREQAVYRRPEEAFGLNVWKRALQPDELEESRRVHDDFYAELVHPSRPAGG